MVDSRATRHICTYRDLFQEYEKGIKGKCVFVGNSTSVFVLGKGNVSLKLHYEKKFSLKNVVHALDIRQNLIYDDLLNRVGVRVTFDFGKVILTNGGEFMGKGFCNEGLFVLDLVTKNKMNLLLICELVANIAKSTSLWHATLGHLNITSIKRIK